MKNPQPPRQKLPIPKELQRNGFDSQALHDLFLMQPDNGPLLPAEMVQRALFPRWEVIVPAKDHPVELENQRLENLLQDRDENLEHLDPH